MYIQELRNPVQPPVPIVQSPSPGATATNTGKATEDPRLVWGGGGAERADADFTHLDRALIRYVTGEDVETLPDRGLSPFALQILTDRRAGRLPAGHEVDLGYLGRTSHRLAGLGDRNPFSGALLRRAVDFLRSREDGRLDVVM